MGATATHARRIGRAVAAAVLVLGVCGFMHIGAAHADSNLFVINSLGDQADATTADGLCATTTGDCTLRAAIQQANADDSDDEIDFGLSGQVTLASALPELVSDMSIVGETARNTIYRGDDAADFGVFHIALGTATLSNLTIRNGYITDSSYCGGGIEVDYGARLSLDDSAVVGNTATEGGGICSLGTATITDSSVGLNFATSGVAQGGGIYSSGPLTLTDTSIDSNEAGGGGGVDQQSKVLNTDGVTFRNNISFGNGHLQPAGGGAVYVWQASLIAKNTTFAGNRADGSFGGAIFVPTNFGALSLTSSTVVGNSAGIGGGIGDAEAFGADFTNTLVAQNAASVSGPDVSGGATSTDHDLIGDGDGTSGFTNGVNGDQVGTGTNPIDPEVQTDPSGAPQLQNNGGPTPTIALLPGSPAINKGSDSVLGAPDDLTTDQRGTGFPRKEGTHVDIGAFEAPAPNVVLNAPRRQAALSGTSVPVEATASSNAGIRAVDFLLDGHRFASVTSPSSGTTYATTLDTTAYVDGAHVVVARAVDANGYTRASSHAITIDNTAPTVIATTPSPNTVGVDPSTSVTATFSEAMRARTVNGHTFKLYLKGAHTPIAATVTYSAADDQAVLAPTSALAPGATYKAVVAATASDVAGNPLGSNVSWMFQVAS